MENQEVGLRKSTKIIIAMGLFLAFWMLVNMPVDNMANAGGITYNPTTGAQFIEQESQAVTVSFDVYSAGATISFYPCAKTIDWYANCSTQVGAAASTLFIAPGMNGTQFTAATLSNIVVSGNTANVPVGSSSSISNRCISNIRINPVVTATQTCVVTVVVNWTHH